ncbi:Deoxycytidine triphosphate deaminase [Candidatus Magnetoovum chiemensis]|nr:Deoxycytidine triphosphate deaminase [Candidatus Magnetoovum chiemensis]
MTLSDRDIKKYIEDGRIKITPKPDYTVQLGACSIDMRLGKEFCVFEHSKYSYIDLRSDFQIKNIMKEIIINEDEQFIMQPGEFALATTIENIEIPDDLLGRIDGRSSLGRLGLIIHGTASTFDPGWRGKATLELSNIGTMPIALYYGMRICAFSFEMLTSPAETPYYKKTSAKYKNQDKALPSRFTKDDL